MVCFEREKEREREGGPIERTIRWEKTQSWLDWQSRERRDEWVWQEGVWSDHRSLV